MQHRMAAAAAVRARPQAAAAYQLRGARGREKAHVAGLLRPRAAAAPRPTAAAAAAAEVLNIPDVDQAAQDLRLQQAVLQGSVGGGRGRMGAYGR